MITYSFDVPVDESALTTFAEMSGDMNPLHTDAEYASATPYRRRVLHGAFAAGLVSRMAGMHLPGTDCLLHDMRLKFVSPMIPPLTLRVEGKVERQTEHGGEVRVLISNATDGRRHVEAQYSFGLHTRQANAVADVPEALDAEPPADDRLILVSGASGALGAALENLYGKRVVAISRSDQIDSEAGRKRLLKDLGRGRVFGAVHCGWPWPDNEQLINLADVPQALSAGLVEPLAQAVGLASLMREAGAPQATLALIGSTVGRAGRHMWRAPVYSLGKAGLPTLAQILGAELSAHDMRCVCVTFDTLSGGMSAQLSAAAKVAMIDRSPWGRLMSMDDAARSIAWVLDSSTDFISGATVDLSGGAIP